MSPRGALVFIHGYLDGPATWQPLLQALALPGWRTLAVALDAETAARAGGNTLEALALQVRGQIAAAGVAAQAPVVLVGHSMGGQVAELVAAAEPARVQALVLITPAPLAGYPLQEDTLAAFRRAARQKDQALVAQARSARAVAQDEQVRSILGATASGTSVPASLAALDAWITGHPLGQSPSPVAAPVLLLTSQDKFFARDFLAAEAARRFDAVQVRHVAGAGHWPHLEQPARVAAVLAEFLRTLAPQPAAPAAPAALQAVADELQHWFFREYFDTWVAIGAGRRPLADALAYWGAPLHAASVLQTRWLMTREAVLGQIEASQAPLKAAGYDHTVVLDSEITVFNPTGAAIDAIWSRRRADGQELQRIASHFEVHRTEAGWRVVALANRLTEAAVLEGTRQVRRGAAA